MNALQPPTLEQIKQRLDQSLEARLPGLDPLAASRIKTLHATLAGALYSLYAFALKIEDQLFPDTADAEHLLRAGAWRGYSLKLGTFAQGTLRFEVPAGSAIALPQGTALVAEGTTQRFQTETEVRENNGEIRVTVRAEEEGEAAHFQPGQRFLLLNPIPYTEDGRTHLLQEGIALSTFSGGRATESIESLRQRVLHQAPLTPDRFGRKGDFAHWAMQASDRITGAWEFPNIDQAGTLQISIALAGKNPADSNAPPAGIIQQVLEAIQAQAPAFLAGGVRPDGTPTPPMVRIVALQPLFFALRVQITPDTPTLRNALLEAVQTLAQTTAPGQTLSRATLLRTLLALPELQQHQHLARLHPAQANSALPDLPAQPLEDIPVPPDRSLHLAGIDFTAENHEGEA